MSAAHLSTAELDAMIPDERPRPAPRIVGKPAVAEPMIALQRLGPSYRVDARPLGARFVFRDVRTDRELAADVTVSLGSRHVFRTTVTLSLAGRDKIAKTAAELTRGDVSAWRLATFAAVEAILEAEEQLGTPVDLRTASLTLPAGGLHVARPFWPVGSLALTSPGDAGKSTMARALAVSLAGAVAVMPGIEPIGRPRPVLYVAAEDPVAYWHGRSVEAICRGIGMNRRDLPEPIELFDARGRPLHRIARAIAERAADFGAVILDSQQALLAQVDASGGIRDRDSLFWHAVDQSERPTLIIAHPNRADARDWQRADGPDRWVRGQSRPFADGVARDVEGRAGHRRDVVPPVQPVQHQEQPRTEGATARVRRRLAVRVRRRSRRPDVYGVRAVGSRPRRGSPADRDRTGDGGRLPGRRTDPNDTRTGARYRFERRESSPLSGSATRAGAVRRG